MVYGDSINDAMLKGGGMRYWWGEEQNDIVFKTLAFLISPVLGFLASLLRINTKSSYFIIFFSFLTFGASFTVESHIKRSDAEFYLDGMFHRAEFEGISNFSFGELELYLLYGSEDGSRDVLDKVVKFLVSRFTENYHFFFFVIAILYSFFFLKTLRYLTGSIEFHKGFFYLLLVYLFCFAGVFGINGVRFVPAAWMSVYAIFKIFVDKNIKYIGLIVLAALLHSAMWIVFVLVFISCLLCKHFYNLRILLIPSLFISLFLGCLASSIIILFASIIPEPFSSWMIEYASGDISNEGQGRFFDVFWLLKHVHMFIFAYILAKKTPNILRSENIRQIFVVTNVFVLFSNFTIGIPSLGARFSGITFPFLAYMWIKVYSNKSYKILIYSVPFVYFYDIIYYMPRLYYKVLEFDFLYTSPLFLFYKYLS